MKTIIIPCYNGVVYLHTCLKCVLMLYDVDGVIFRDNVLKKVRF